MKSQIKSLLRSDFVAFARKALFELDGTEVSGDRYLELLATQLLRLEDGASRRLVINLPPRHLKTQLGAVCFGAWLLAHRPQTKILIVTYAEPLARAISRSMRSIVTAAWFRELFPTRLAKGHAAAADFATAEGGWVYATSLHGAVTGFGAEFVIADDIHNVTEARSPKLLQETIEEFCTSVMSRLNRPNKGRILVIGHRIHENDISARLLTANWDSVVLPLVATEDCIYPTAYGPWRRRKGELLRPDDWDLSDVEDKRRNSVNPSFELFYQQDAEGQALPPIHEKDFGFCGQIDVANLPRILSVDPGTGKGAGKSFSAIQAWAYDQHKRYLLAQHRERLDFHEFARAVTIMARRHRPHTIVVEETANGPALLSELHRKLRNRVEAVVPRGSKAARLRPHLEKISGRRIALMHSFEDSDGFIKEFVEFPHGKFTDQIDAFTQAMTWLDENGHNYIGQRPESAGYMAVAYGSSYAGPGPGLSTDPHAPGIMAVGKPSAGFRPWWR
jgi:predicted phage terminase large subunit-like protein